MAKATDMKYIDQRFDDHNNWIKSVESKGEENTRRISDIEVSHAGMAEAIKGLAEDMRDFKKGMEEMRSAMIYGFLGVIATGVIVGIVIYLAKGG